MKRAIAAICALALMLACAAAQAQEFFTLPEIREQAAQGSVSYTHLTLPTIRLV